MRVSHVSPTYFSPESFLGGGERFAEELSRGMAGVEGVEQVKLVSFGRRYQRQRPTEGYERVILESRTQDPMTPFSLELFHELRGADVIHCHQYFVLPTFLAALQGRLQGSRVFVSDLGGGGWTPGYQIDQSRWITAHLPISRYAARMLPRSKCGHHVISGGVDLARYRMRPDPQHDGSVVFLGRVLPHKGLHYLIEGLPLGVSLQVIGPASDGSYLDRLRQLAAGKDVHFLHGLDDEAVITSLQRAMVLVHPTPVDANGDAGVHELFGLALLEAMACGCPVVATDAASLPEIVRDGIDGELVPPCNPKAIGDAILRLRDDRETWHRRSIAARDRAELFSWPAVAQQCVAAYRMG
jgi:glycosyltransferase involved in cell wall biosynthesis